MTKKAVLFGCNYPGQKGELKGCINDVMMMKEILVDLKGFDESDITILIDTDDQYESPTGANMKKALNKLVAEASVGDILFVHYSGHGTQVPSFSEEDWKNEALCPTDMNLIVDDDLRDIFNKLDPSIPLTVITDCCHSGGMLDHKAIQIDGDKSQDVATGDAPPAKNRALSIQQVAEMLSKQLGHEVDSDGAGVRSALQRGFPEDASKFATSLVAGLPISDELKGAANKLLGGLFGKKSSTPPPAEAGGKVPAKPHVDDEIGVLITGCQSTETSADVRAGGTAYGALSNTLVEAINENPNATYRELVTTVRAKLHTKGFKQNPCLECSNNNADKPFIC
eukprot:CAMPEP_0174902612 /NCGR_PEP_ID=MMETSP0167-20121228/38783_1 /TAXON_ID=38298 /ORGANISM="Rhodella maculata, Strain CCMP736" /LENGTH=338 /DNA_ID=CAMNT_0016144689 /DNA_START=46 /DNA_END=1062 /DNA_ORIENTATION=+